MIEALKSVEDIRAELNKITIFKQYYSAIFQLRSTIMDLFKTEFNMVYNCQKIASAVNIINASHIQESIALHNHGSKFKKWLDESESRQIMYQTYLDIDYSMSLNWAHLQSVIMGSNSDDTLPSLQYTLQQLFQNFHSADSNIERFEYITSNIAEFIKDFGEAFPKVDDLGMVMHKDLLLDGMTEQHFYAPSKCCTNYLLFLRDVKKHLDRLKGLFAQDYLDQQLKRVDRVVDHISSLAKSTQEVVRQQGVLTLITDYLITRKQQYLSKINQDDGSLNKMNHFYQVLVDKFDNIEQYFNQIFVGQKMVYQNVANQFLCMIAPVIAEAEAMKVELLRIPAQNNVIAELNQSSSELYQKLCIEEQQKIKFLKENADELVGNVTGNPSQKEDLGSLLASVYSPEGNSLARQLNTESPASFTIASEEEPDTPEFLREEDVSIQSIPWSDAHSATAQTIPTPGLLASNAGYVDTPYPVPGLAAISKSSQMAEVPHTPETRHGAGYPQTPTNWGDTPRPDQDAIDLYGDGHFPTPMQQRSVESYNSEQDTSESRIYYDTDEAFLDGLDSIDMDHAEILSRQQSPSLQSVLPSENDTMDESTSTLSVQQQLQQTELADEHEQTPIPQSNVHELARRLSATLQMPNTHAQAQVSDVEGDDINDDWVNMSKPSESEATQLEGPSGCFNM